MATKKAQEPPFFNSMVCKQIPENCPDWVIAKLGFNIENLLEEIEELKEAGVITNGWLNVEIKRSKKGGMYGEVNTWKPTAKAKRKARS